MSASERRTKSDRRVADASEAVTSLLAMHERSSDGILDLVGRRMQALEKASKELQTLTSLLRANGEITKDTDVLLRKLHNDITANLRMTASIRVAVQRSPSLKHYHLIAE